MHNYVAVFRSYGSQCDRSYDVITSQFDRNRRHGKFQILIEIFVFLGGHYPNSDTEDIGGDKINFLLENIQEIKTITGKNYSWIKSNQNFQGFYITEYLFPSITWSRFSNVLEVQPEVNFKFF